MQPTHPTTIADTTAASRLSWAAVLGLITACAGCLGSTGSTNAPCETDKLPKTDPCFMRSCCDSITVGPDGGVIEDAGTDGGAGAKIVMCGACNG